MFKSICNVLTVIWFFIEMKTAFTEIVDSQIVLEEKRTNIFNEWH